MEVFPMEAVPFPIPIAAIIGNHFAKGPFHEFQHVLILHSNPMENIEIAKVILQDFGNIHFLSDLINVELWYT